MLVKDLIKVLEKKIEDNKPYLEVMGELAINVDVFSESEGGNFTYSGIAGTENLIIDTIVGGGLVISAFSKDYTK